jgi:hypothetical protein
MRLQSGTRTEISKVQNNVSASRRRAYSSQPRLVACMADCRRVIIPPRKEKSLTSCRPVAGRDCGHAGDG